MPYLLKCCPDIGCMLWQVTLCKREESCKDALVWLTVCAQGCHLCKHPSHLLTGECRPPAGLQKCENDAAIQRHAIQARIRKHLCRETVRTQTRAGVVNLIPEALQSPGANSWSVPEFLLTIGKAGTMCVQHQHRLELNQSPCE